MIGHQIGGRYRIIQRLGGGGMGVVYQAEDMLLGRDVAIKVLRAHLAEDDAFRHRFAREGRSAAALSHPNIVQVYDVGETPEGVPYLVMEYVSGPTLEKILAERGFLPEREAVDLAAQVTAALVEAHRRGVVHRDIKPLNILVRPDGTVKVADFGIARAQSGATLVNTGTIVGSAHYVSPEQARGGYVDEKTDVYSLGIVLFEMLTGRTPFQGDTAVAVALKHLQDEVPSPSALASVSRRLEAVVLRALEKDPARRYPSATALLADLEAVRAGLDGPQGGGRRPASATRRAGVWVPIVAAVIVVLVGLAAFLYSRYIAPQAVAVPALAGSPVAAAESALHARALKWRIAAFQDDARLPYGDVVSASPAPGRAVLPGRTVSLVLSAGPPAVTGGVPNVQGQQVAVAEEELTGVGLSVVQVLHRPSNVYGAGQVIDTLPPAGTAAWQGQSVSLEVSTGTTARAVAMPALVGQALAAWQADLAARGLSVGDIRYGSSSAPAGQVLSQEPAPGTPVSAASSISLILSAGAGGAVLAAPAAVQQQSATIALPTHGFATGTPVMIQVVSEDGAEPVLVVPHGQPGQRLTVTYTWRGDGTLRIWFAGQVVKSLVLPVASVAGGA